MEGITYLNVFAISQRGNQTIEAQNVYCVFPCGGHQPLADEFGDPGEVSALENDSSWNSSRKCFPKKRAATIRRYRESFLEAPTVKPLVKAILRNRRHKDLLNGLRH